MYKKTGDNPVETREDLQALAREMIGAAAGRFGRGGISACEGEHGAKYSHKTAWIEGLLRPLFGLVPLCAGGFESSLDSGAQAFFRERIKAGTDPDSNEYWGELEGKDQKIVEMASLGIGLVMAPELVWEPLDEESRENLARWLRKVNEAPLAANNWLFFPVIVNIGLKKAGASYSQEILEKALEGIEKNYLGDGWYSDGPSPQRDYYVAFAMHFYGLIYAAVMEEEDPARCRLYKERAALFAGDFIWWFGAEGDGLPFGRSLTYRFAMSAFWGALAWAGVEVFSWGVIKGLLLRNIRWWIRQPVWDGDGVLTVGYRYPNLKMAEFYNAPGSPAWAMKAFLALALPESHPFWSAVEEELPELGRVSVQKHPFMIVMRGERGRHVQALTSGQYARFEPTFMSAKYEKFAYSNVFGFSVPGGEYGYDQGAFDSMLALCERGDGLYRVRRNCLQVKVSREGIYSLWKPWEDVTVETWLIPWGSWHVRVHRVVSARTLTGGEGAYAVGWDGSGYPETEGRRVSGAAAEGRTGISGAPAAGLEESDDAMARAWHTLGCTAIVNLEGRRRGQVVLPHPNTNVLYSRTKLPCLMGDMEEGETWLACAVLGTRTWDEAVREWSRTPVYSRDSHGFSVSYGGETTCWRSDTEEWGRDSGKDV